MGRTPAGASEGHAPLGPPRTQASQMRALRQGLQLRRPRPHPRSRAQCGQAGPGLRRHQERQPERSLVTAMGRSPPPRSSLRLQLVRTTAGAPAGDAPPGPPSLSWTLGDPLKSCVTYVPPAERGSAIGAKSSGMSAHTRRRGRALPRLSNAAQHSLASALSPSPPPGSWLRPSLGRTTAGSPTREALQGPPSRPRTARTRPESRASAAPAAGRISATAATSCGTNARAPWRGHTRAHGAPSATRRDAT